VGRMGSGLVDLRMGRSETSPEDSTAAFNASILCIIKALCLLFGVVGCTNRDCDLVSAVAPTLTDPATPSIDFDNLVSMDGKASNTGDARGRDGLEFRPLR
jgi:hypothetical protein